LRHLEVDALELFSGGSEPAEPLNRDPVTAMAEGGIEITSHLSMPWDDEIVRAADVVVTMGCGDACMLFPGNRYLDWERDDPDPLRKSLAQIRPIRDEIAQRVCGLMAERGVEPLQ
jgi:arsenate reductase